MSLSKSGGKSFFDARRTTDAEARDSEAMDDEMLDSEALDVGTLLADFASGVLDMENYRAVIALKESVTALLERKEKENDREL